MHVLASLDCCELTPCRHNLGEAVAAMRRYEVAATEIELACEELRAAARSLGRVVGAIDVEEVLSSLFKEFCIGK